MAEQSLTLSLFDPGMTPLHRVGLAGLYMTLEKLDPKKYEKLGSWELEPSRVHLRWNGKPAAFIGDLLEDAFGIGEGGVIEFAAHRGHPMGQAQRFLVHSAILGTFLQHPLVKGVEGPVAVSLDLEDRQVLHSHRPATWYSNQKSKILFTRAGDFRSAIELAGWILPGGGVRHNEYAKETKVTERPELLLALLFAPAASLYFLISRKGSDGKYDRRFSAAVVLPEVVELRNYAKAFSRYLDAPAERLHASGLGDAGLLGLASLQLYRPSGMIQALTVDSCTVISMGTVGWSRQKTRTAVAHVRDVDLVRLNLFAIALSQIGNRLLLKKSGGYWVATSLSRGLIADNIAAGRSWFDGFFALMQSQELAGLLSFERKGLNNMVQQAPWPRQEDKLFVEAVHNALRNRYGALAARAKTQGNAPQFKREFERIRTSLMRAKNRDTLRAEVADLFARGGINRVLQGDWEKILGLFGGGEWQRARDLALLGLASYAGKGVEEVESGEAEGEEDEA
ncbi:MAG TPA: type I-MYXAN CRISPR-associated Cas8a1/Cmx1 [bacterium]